MLYSIDGLLIAILVSPLIGAICLIAIPSEEEKLLKLTALNFTSFSFLGTLILWACFQKSTPYFQYVNQLHWVHPIKFGLDGISLFFLLLTTFLIPLCILASWRSVSFNLKGFLLAFVALDFFLIGAFAVLDLFFFYVFFESVLIPMFFIIGIWGSRERKILAAYYFFLYTLLGSASMLLSILYLYNQVGTADYEVLLVRSFSTSEQLWVWLTLFLGFASKVPMMPVHLWLPEAHVEAPTAGSVILAGVLLKLGTYGFIRFNLPLFPKGCFFFTPLVYMLAVMGIIYASLTAIRQTDFKRIIAYTSIAHMNLVILGIFSFNIIGIEGAILQSLSHGFIASGLFLVIGVVYDRYGSRLVQYYGGLATTMPLYSIIFLVLTMSNISFPGTSSFIGEFLLLLGSFQINTTVSFLGATSVVLGGTYSLWLFNRVVFGNLKNQYTESFFDVSLREVILFLPLILCILITGVYPNILLDSMHMSVTALVERISFYSDIYI